MPARHQLLVNGGFYHVFNRGVASLPFFNRDLDYKKFIKIFSFYRFNVPLLKFSRFSSLPIDLKEKKLEKGRPLVEILAYCLMPNHFHFLLKQVADKGIAQFVMRLSDSYAKYFNTRVGRKGPLFEGRFRAVEVDNEQQLLHLSRYVHLNPYSAFVVKKIEDLFTYPYSSLDEYLRLTGKKICNTEIVMNSFASNIERYKNFLVDQADYQQNLQMIKSQLIDSTPGVDMERRARC